MRTLLLVILLLYRPLVGQDSDAVHTAGFANGRAWIKLVEPLKTSYLAGVMDGLFLLTFDNPDAAVQTALNRSLKIYRLGKFKPEEIVNEVDWFYTEGANARVPVIEAVEYSVKKMNGATVADLDALLSRMRTRAAHF